MAYLYSFRVFLFITACLSSVFAFSCPCVCADIELEPITVYIQPGENITHENPSRDEDIINRSWRETSSIDILLDTEPGVDISRRGVSGIQSDMSIRGCGAGQVSVAINGVTVNDPQTSHHNLDLPLPQFAVENIEIVKGQSTKPWAQSGIGGSVNIKARRPRDTQSWVFFGRGSDCAENTGVYSCFAKEDKGVNVAAEQSSSEGYRQGTDYKQFAVSSSAAFPFGDKVSNYALAGYGEKEYGASNFYVPYDSREWTDTLFLNWQSSAQIGNLTVRPNLYYRRHHDKFMLDIRRQDFYINRHITKVSGAMVEAEIGFDTAGELGFLIDICNQSIKSTRLVKDSRLRASYALSWKVHHNPAAGFDLSARVDSYSDFNTRILPQAGIYIRPYNFIKFRAAVSRSLMPADYTQLYYEDAVSSGNRNLSPESAINYEAGFDITAAKGNMDLSLTVFNRHTDNMIDWVKYDVSDQVFRAENIAKVRTLGFEGAASAFIAGCLKIKTGYSYSGSDIINSRDFISRYVTGRDEHKLFAMAQLFLPFGVQTVDIIYKNKKDYNNYFLTNCNMNYDLNRNISLFFAVDNVFNKTYWDITDSLMPGRQYLAGMRAKF
ncbi:MAG: TonB-dependent receptor [Candidatus Omnitrophica bacterium]|jgi:iron complex outermembrane receptor protein|nr:TonB-dependent receptor [Candidatus Omnitrophota bacterium]